MRFLDGSDLFCHSLTVSEQLLNISNLSLRDHPFKTSACLRGGGVKNLPNLPTDSTKKLPTVGG